MALGIPSGPARAGLVVSGSKPVRAAAATVGRPAKKGGSSSGAGGAFGVSAGELSQFGLTPAALRQMVAAEVAAQVGPQRSALAQEQAVADKQFQQRQAAVKNLTADYAGLLKGISPDVQSTYDNAGNAVADYAKGFSGTIQDQLNGAAPAEQALLATAGAPQTQVDASLGHLTAPTDALYGMHGAIPAGALATEGAAFTSAAKMLPGEAVGRGQQIAETLLGQQNTTDAGYRQKLATLLASVPGLRQTAVNDVLKNARSDIAEQLLLQKYGLQTRTEIGNLTGVDPATGKPTYKAATAATKAAQAAQTRAAKTHGAAVERRNKALNSLTVKLSTWVHDQRHKTGAVVVGYQPREKTVKDPVTGLPSTQYLTPQGWVTSQTGQPPANTIKQPVYDYHHAVPFDYNGALKYITRTLTLGLKGYGYKPSDIQEIAAEILGPPPPAPQVGQPSLPPVGATHPVP